jgi:hypothetical protein
MSRSRKRDQENPVQAKEPQSQHSIPSLDPDESPPQQPPELQHSVPLVRQNASVPPLGPEANGAVGQPSPQPPTTSTPEPVPATEANPAGAASPAPESPSSIESILDKSPLTQRITEALARADRVDKQRLCEQLGSPISEFNAAVVELVEAKRAKDDAINKTLYLLLTEEEKKEYQEDKATVRRDDRFKALTRIHDHRTYREDYPSWDEFLHHELCLENPHDWWETEKRTARIQQQMYAQGLKLKVPLNKNMARHLNRARHDPALFASCIKEFQALPQDRQIARRLGEIVERHLDRQNKLASLRQFVPDATEEELAILAPIYAADHRWKKWYPQVQQQLQERVQTSGRSIRGCMLELAGEIKSLPNDRAMLAVARGAALVPLVNDLMRMLGQWEREQKKKEEIEAWERQGKRLGIYQPQGKDTAQETKDKDMPDQQATEHQDEGQDEEQQDHEEDHEAEEEGEAADLYDVDLTGDFHSLAGREGFEGLSSEELANLLHELADAIVDGATIQGPSGLAIRPAVRQQQSA